MPAERPNIVQIIADDMGHGDLGCFNFGISHTPTLDQLIQDGVSLSQHYSASPVCAPARAALLTGRYSHRTGAVDTLDGRGLDRISLRERTFADALSAAGYATGLIGKWHNGSLDRRYHPNRRGFAEFYGFRGGWVDYWDWRLERNGATEKADGRYLTDVLTDEAVAFAHRHRSEPFYLQLAYNAPHYPLQAPADRVAPYVERGTLSTGVSTIYAMIEAMDAGIARVLDTLDELDIADHTLVLFMSDNGPHFGSFDGLSLTRFNCGFNGAKKSVHEGGIRVPATLRWPNGLEGGRVIHDMVHFTDWAPTFLAVAGAGPVEGTLPWDGVNVLPLLRGERGQVHTTRFWQLNRYEPVARCNAAMRDGDWKLIHPWIDEAMQHEPADLAMDDELRYEPDQHTDIRRAPYPARSLLGMPPEPELYNLAADPLECQDVAADHPQRVAGMSAALGRWFEDVEGDRRRAWSE